MDVLRRLYIFMWLRKLDWLLLQICKKKKCQYFFPKSNIIYAAPEGIIYAALFAQKKHMSIFFFCKNE